MPAAVRPHAVRPAARPIMARRPASVRGMRYFIREGIEAFRRNGLMSVAAVTITVVTLDALAGGVERRLQVIAYLRDGLRPSEIDAVQARLERLPGVAGVVFVSKE